MGEVAEAEFRSEIELLQYSDARFKDSLSPLFIHIPLPISQGQGQFSHTTITAAPSLASLIDWQINEQQQNQNPNDAWLPITESRNGNAFYATFHILNSNIGIQALMLPVAFSTLGWAWGSICLSIAFIWKLYSVLLLVALHESVPGIRFSRYLFLAMAAFGKRLGKVAAIFPVMYLSGGTCVLLIITGGGTMQLFYRTLCHEEACDSHSLSGAEWFLVFTCIAILIAQLPNLNSISRVSLVGGIIALTYCNLLWVLSLKKGRPTLLTYTPSHQHLGHPTLAKTSDILNAIGLIVLSFRGHNVLLEIQGTLPSNPKHPSHEPMRKAVIISYLLIAMCVFPLGIAGFWAYGNKIASCGGLLNAFPEFHVHQVAKFTMGVIYLLIIAHCLTSFQIYAMPVFDNLELRYTSIKKQPCPIWVRTCFRLFFGGLTFFISVTFPFLPTLSALLGGFTLVPLTYAYPCFMWISIKKPPRNAFAWFFNVVLGSLGMVLSALLVAAALWTLADKGLHANFFNPKLSVHYC